MPISHLLNTVEQAVSRAVLAQRGLLAAASTPARLRARLKLGQYRRRGGSRPQRSASDERSAAARHTALRHAPNLPSRSQRARVCVCVRDIGYAICKWSSHASTVLKLGLVEYS